MRDISDQLDGIIDDLLGVVDTLQLGGLIQVDQVLVKIKPGSSQQGAGIVVQIGCDALSFLFLEPDGGIQQELLLVLFHALQPHLIPDDFSLMKNDKDDQPYGKRQHSYGAKEKHLRDPRVSDF